LKRRIFGLETEYGLTGTEEVRTRFSLEELGHYVVAACGPSTSPGSGFLENGGRLYLDTGGHPEYATPECDRLLDLCAYDKAGECLVETVLARAEAQLRAEGTSGRLPAYKNNTDSAGHTYGCHENYLVSRDVPMQYLVEILVPFFVTRQVFAGAGKVLPMASGTPFALAQRAEHIVQETSMTSVDQRPIINLRDEPHADSARYRRLHVLIGDANLSEVATWLKVGTTALVLDTIEDGAADDTLGLASPIEALVVISRDPTLRTRVALKDGRSMTALEVQRAYLSACERHAAQADRSSETEMLLASWARLLEQLGRDPRICAREVDWVAKLALIEAYRARDRLAWDDPRVALLDLAYHDVRRDHGLYHLLIRNGHMDRLVTDPAIEVATVRPPKTTRAWLRGRFISWLRARGQPYTGDWMWLRPVGWEDGGIHCPDPFRSTDERVEGLLAQRGSGYGSHSGHSCPSSSAASWDARKHHFPALLRTQCSEDGIPEAIGEVLPTAPSR
jgi:proteasome accessory factor A